MEEEFVVGVWGEGGEGGDLFSGGGGVELDAVGEDCVRVVRVLRLYERVSKASPNVSLSRRRGEM